ncbi:Dextranase precursor [Tsuneonella dongtanensis]|uniref:Dextranase n=1 Tax=Tsuneonella dongtanensis TaxID=692370 RepID=A0A1B2AB27_9SPHN|nr:hypothetical protein [Tsuneonella dongtanensis]ANY19346.1 Dextranase precursor [Tsuneonella dongtanensis]
MSFLGALLLLAQGVSGAAVDADLSHGSVGTSARFSHDTTIGSRFEPPDDWDEIVIGADVTITGSIAIPETRSRPLIIRGEDRKTSVLKGTGTYDHIQQRNAFARSHSAITSLSLAPLTIRDLTSRDPDKFNFVGRGPLLAERVDIVDTRKAYTTDGIGGGRGTRVDDARIDTYDDSLKVYSPDMTFDNVTITMNRNGAPIQLGWGTERGSATIRNLTVIANSPTLYNQGIIARANKKAGVGPLESTLVIEGLKVIVPEGMARPKLFQFGTRSGLEVDDYKVTVTGLCSGAMPAYWNRAAVDAETEVLQGGAVEIVTPDCR